MARIQSTPRLRIALQVISGNIRGHRAAQVHRAGLPGEFRRAHAAFRLHIARRLPKSDLWRPRLAAGVPRHGLAGQHCRLRCPGERRLLRLGRAIGFLQAHVPL